MRVQFDLTPEEYYARERKRHSFNPLRLIMSLLFVAFLATTIGYIAYAFMEMQGLQSEIEMKEDEVASLEASQTGLNTEIARLKAKEEQFVKTLEIMRNEPPTLEVMNALETHLSPGMGLTNVRFVPAAAKTTARSNRAQKNVSELVTYTATVEATSATEDQIVALTDGLSGSGVFSGVSMPSSTKDDETKRVNFNLTLDVLPFGKINSAPGGEAGKEPTL